MSTFKRGWLDTTFTFPRRRAKWSFTCRKWKYFYVYLFPQRVHHVSQLEYRWENGRTIYVNTLTQIMWLNMILEIDYKLTDLNH